ncbi:DNA polymerase I [Salinibacter sp. 10B]|uniref:DNA polymerase I n=1 Tax=Salinibacter sp. 10B TaxID=1923971 RepID=UPI000CF48C36|nr:DNA polymerase I [Salinibacter sp. 10B]PQJ35782.1 DNA polymerase I [Salinibacter sp. 10B]
MPESVPSTSEEEEKTLYLIDAMSLAYRAHYIFISRPLINSKGQNTSAAYGFTNSLLKLIDDHDIEHAAVVFDEGEEDTFRKEIYEEYKAHRDPPPDELLENLPFIKKIVEAMDIPVLEVPNVEADDVIGTLATQAEDDGADVVIVSPDKDFKQLLSEHVSIYKPAKGDQDFEILTDETFREEHELDPVQFIDMLALMGDSSDNVPGVYGIGEKTAQKLLREYHSVENLIEHADDLSGKRAREGMQEHAEEAKLSKRLVRIRTELDVGLDWHQLRRANPDEDKLRALFNELEFGSLLDRMGIDGESSEDEAKEPTEDPALEFDFGPYEEVQELDPDAVDYDFVQNRGQLEQFVSELGERDRYAFDAETTSTDPMYASLVGLSFSWADEQGVYVPTPLPDGMSTDAVLDMLGPLLEADTTKVGHNLKYDLLVLRRHGVEVGGPLVDTMVAHYLVAPEENHNLDDVARSVLNYKMVPISDLLGDGEDISMRDVAVEETAPYACEDADIALRLADALEERLEEDELQEIAEEMEYPLVRVLAEMEHVGITVDTDVLDEISSRLESELSEIESEIYDLAGEEFNINSPQQLGVILFEKLDLPVVSKTPTGNPSTKESVLQELSTEHEIPGLVLDWRSTYKIKSTYLDALGELVHPETGRIHTSFNQTRTSTGRLSSSDPNLQNIPIRTEVGREIRRAFVPRDGWKLMAADYAQIELRILASMSGDEAMIETFREEGDIHTDAAARVYDIDPDEVTSDQRRKAKEVNYGIPYGISPWGLAQRLRMPFDEANDLIKQYRKSYSGVSRLLNELVEQAQENGYAQTMLGRRRYLPDIDSSNSNQRSAAERVAVNMPIQGTQADMIKIAMNRIHERLADATWDAEMLLQVHDELVFELPPDEVDEVRSMVEAEMRDALPLDDVPVVIDIGVGDHWLDAH